MTIFNAAVSGGVAIVFFLASVIHDRQRSAQISPGQWFSVIMWNKLDAKGYPKLILYLVLEWYELYDCPLLFDITDIQFINQQIL